MEFGRSTLRRIAQVCTFFPLAVLVVASAWHALVVPFQQPELTDTQRLIKFLNFIVDHVYIIIGLVIMYIIGRYIYKYKLGIRI